MSEQGGKQGVPPIENRFKPGQSGNPRGRPRGTVGLLEAIREQLKIELQGGDPKARKQVKDAVAKAYVAAMRKGSIKHVADFLDRDEGKPAQPIDLSGSIEIQAVPAEIAAQRQAELLAEASLADSQLQLPAPAGTNGNGRGHR